MPAPPFPFSWPQSVATSYICTFDGSSAQSNTVTSIAAPKDIITVDSKASLHSAFQVLSLVARSVCANMQTLVDAHILSAPVYDAATSSWIGFLDVRDLVSFVVFVYDEQKVPRKENAHFRFFQISIAITVF